MSTFAEAMVDEGGLAQLARAPALHAGGHRFDSDILHKFNLVPSKRKQMVFFIILMKNGT